MPSLVAEGLGQENDRGLLTFGHVGGELFPPDDGRIAPCVMLRVPVVPGVEDRSGRRIFQEFHEGVHVACATHCPLSGQAFAAHREEINPGRGRRVLDGGRAGITRISLAFNCFREVGRWA